MVPMSEKPDPRLPLTPLTMAILLALADGDRHGYALMQAVETQTDGALKPGTGSLYAALERLMNDGLIIEAPPSTDANADRRRRTFRITDGGRDLARAEADRMMSVLRHARAQRLAPDDLSAAIRTVAPLPESRN